MNDLLKSLQQVTDESAAVDVTRREIIMENNWEYTFRVGKRQSFSVWSYPFKVRKGLSDYALSAVCYGCAFRDEISWVLGYVRQTIGCRCFETGNGSREPCFIGKTIGTLADKLNNRLSQRGFRSVSDRGPVRVQEVWSNGQRWFSD